ncbi:Hypothetical_protein [Hexamita inflata]|uniref:Hypothetical_protein n=1 Tax=Hexamita inflata TaxID=28002 RepID=A0AA86NS10_9EUKA|nr:Hypothetical protein HINF_LOCUS13077 [Hexamita inflata]
MITSLTEGATQQILFRNIQQIQDFMGEYLIIASTQNKYEFICPGFKNLDNEQKCYCSRRARIVKVEQTDYQKFTLVANEQNEIISKSDEHVLQEMFEIAFEGDHIPECKHSRIFNRNFSKQQNQVQHPEQDSIIHIQSTPSYSQTHSQLNAKPAKKGLLRFRPDHRQSSLTEEKIIQMLVDDNDYHIHITYQAPNTHFLSTGQATLKAPSDQMFEALEEALQIKVYAYKRLVIFLNFDENSMIAFLHQHEKEQYNQLLFYDFIQKYNVRCVYGNQAYSIESLKLLFAVQLGQQGVKV